MLLQLGAHCFDLFTVRSDRLEGMEVAVELLSFGCRNFLLQTFGVLGEKIKNLRLSFVVVFGLSFADDAEEFFVSPLGLGVKGDGFSFARSRAGEIGNSGGSFWVMAKADVGNGGAKGVCDDRINGRAQHFFRIS